MVVLYVCVYTYKPPSTIYILQMRKTEAQMLDNLSKVTNRILFRTRIGTHMDWIQSHLHNHFTTSCVLCNHQVRAYQVPAWHAAQRELKEWEPLRLSVEAGPGLTQPHQLALTQTIKCGSLCWQLQAAHLCWELDTLLSACKALCELPLSGAASRRKPLIMLSSLQGASGGMDLSQSPWHPKEKGSLTGSSRG